jgi:mercuric ion transport protein
MKTSLEKLGTTGAVIAALACPICFPKLALVGAALGLGVFAPYEPYIALALQVLFVVALVGQILSYRSHRNAWLLSLAIATTAAMFTAYYVVPSTILLQLALFALVAASVWQVVELRRCAKCAPA